RRTSILWCFDIERTRDLRRAEIRDDPQSRDRIGNSDLSGELPFADELCGERGRPLSGVRRLRARERREDVSSELATEPEACEPDQRVESLCDLWRRLVTGTQRPRREGFPDGYPARAHVVELHGAGLGVFEIPDELA